MFYQYKSSTMLGKCANKITGYKNEQRHAATRAVIIDFCCIYIVLKTHN